MKRKKSYDKSVYQSLALITQFGINMLVPIGLMIALGMYLDNRFGTSYWVIILFFLGALAGFRNIFRMAKNVYGSDKVSEDKAKEVKSNDRKVKKN